MVPQLLVSRLMHSGVLLHCDPDTTIATAAAMMAERSVSSILVIRNDDVLGIWTERDALAIDFTSSSIFAQPVSSVMSSPVISVPTYMPMQEAAVKFRETGKRHFLVVDADGRAACILSQTDMAINQGIEPYLRLRDVRSATPTMPLSIDGDKTLAEAAASMYKNHAHAAIIDCKKLGLGILTERDIVRLISRNTGNEVVGPLASRPLITVHEEEPLIHARDRLLNLRIRNLAVVNDNNQVIGLVGYGQMLAGVDQLYMKDLRAALERRDSALAQSRRTLQLAERVIASSLEGIMITDAKSRIEFTNPMFTQLTGYNADEVIGKTPALFSSGRHDKAFYDQMWQALAREGVWRGEIWNRRKTGELYLESLTITAVTDDNGIITHYAALFTDITQNRHNEERIRQLAYYDALTGIPNRRLMEDRLEHAIRQTHRNRLVLAVLFIDLDHFKQINDTLGHHVGDSLLLQFTERAQTCLREGDTLARLGGDEFVVILPELNGPEAAKMIAQRLLDKHREDYHIDGHTLSAGASVGISLYSSEVDTARQLLERADAAMYTAKRAGRNAICLFTDAESQKNETSGQTASAHGPAALF
jgi:diguanylate cyclase (GGDEF)-like protein/PAS domain S-box-containing protein